MALRWSARRYWGWMRWAMSRSTNERYSLSFMPGLLLRPILQEVISMTAEGPLAWRHLATASPSRNPCVWPRPLYNYANYAELDRLEGRRPSLASPSPPYQRPLPRERPRDGRPRPPRLPPPPPPP